MGKSNKKQVKKQMVEALELPKDLFFGAVILTITGREEAIVENYKGILEYSNEKIRLQTKTCKLLLCGKNLKIDYYTNEEMKITGFINQIMYEP